MPRTSKIPRYEEYNRLPNCFGLSQVHGGEISSYLDGEHDQLVIELGCGKAGLSLGLAEKYPENLYIGVDIKSDRLWRGAKNAIEAKLGNIVFLQTDIRRIEDFLGEHKVDKIWITFPDPYPKDRHEKHRMVNVRFFEIYERLLKKGGEILFKTDDDDLFTYFKQEVLPSLKKFSVLEEADDLHESSLSDDYKIKTDYENRWLESGLTTKFIRLKFN